jgi:hypothetical protein
MIEEPKRRIKKPLIGDSLPHVPASARCWRGVPTTLFILWGGLRVCSVRLTRPVNFDQLQRGFELSLAPNRTL